jgi:hypothetical protein
VLHDFFHEFTLLLKKFASASLGHEVSSGSQAYRWLGIALVLLTFVIFIIVIHH